MFAYNRLYSIEEACEILRVSRITFYKYRKKYHIQPYAKGLKRNILFAGYEIREKLNIERGLTFKHYGTKAQRTDNINHSEASIEHCIENFISGYE